MDRINATFSVALRRKESGLALLERVVEDTLKLPISHRMAIDLGGFEQVIDSLGGVDVEVPCAISDNFIDARTENGRRMLRVEPGLQHLDGTNAALYVRSRHGRSDWSRARRQRAVLFGIKRRLAESNGLAQLPDFLEKLAPLVTSDMTRAELIRLAQAGSTLKPENIHGVVLGVKEAQPHYTTDRKAVLLPDFAAIDRRLAALFSSELPGAQPALAPCPLGDVALKHRTLQKSGLEPVLRSE
jgi:LCP family protein required for cell wall assembly